MFMTVPDLTADLRLLEEQLLRPAFRNDRAAVAALLADDFVEYGSSGRVFTKEEILDLLAAESPQHIELADFAARLLAPGVAFVTFRAIRRTDSSDSVASLRSSIWIQRDSRWQLLFHQGTRIASTPENP
jgi:hypothetical protein